MSVGKSATRIVFLGTGNPNPDPHRQGPALAIIAGDEPYIVDCGPGVVRQAAASGIAELGVERLDRVFLTHLHSDHTLGLPDLILTPAVTGRNRGIEIWGPPGTDRMVSHIMDAWAEDRQVRIEGGEPSVPTAYKTTVHEIAEGIVLSNLDLTVSAFRVAHGVWEHAFGYRFETPDRVITVSGDTTFCENLIAHARGSDILVHEAYSAKGLSKRTADWQAYHSAYHTSGIDVGRIAAEVSPKVLILCHVLNFGEPPEQVLEEIREHYSGPAVLANDLEVW